MPYRASMEVITPFIETLNVIYDNCLRKQPTVLETAFPRETQWYIHQAFYAARELGVTPYNTMSVVVRRRGPNLLVVYPKFKPTEIGVTIHKFNEADSAKALHGISSLIGVVTATIQAKENILSFPDLEPSLLTQAKAWAARMEHEILSEEPLTIRKKNA